jgi:hypothetical protein
MADRRKEGELTSENILRIADELVRQVDRTKKLVVVMIVAVVVGIPLSWHVTPLLLGTPYNFRVAGIVTIIAAGTFVVVGAIQWAALTRWTVRYKAYKELQEKIDAELDFEAGQPGGGGDDPGRPRPTGQ